MPDFGPIVLTLKLALLSTIILLLLGIPLAYLLSESKSRFRPVWEALISMPLVLPPTVIGFYLLLAFRPSAGLGHFLEQNFGLRLLFSFEGLVMASVIYSLPFMVNPVYAAFRALPASLKEAAYVLGYSKTQTLLKILLPNIKPALVTAAVLSFAHVIGEFGVVLMIGGNIPGETRVASIAIYDEVEALNYGAANSYSLLLIALTFAILLGVYLFNHRFSKSPQL